EVNVLEIGRPELESDRAGGRLSGGEVVEARSADACLPALLVDLETVVLDVCAQAFLVFPGEDPDEAGRVLRDEGARGASVDDGTAIENDDAVAEQLRLVHVMGGDEDRLACLTIGEDALPEEVADGGIEAGR